MSKPKSTLINMVLVLLIITGVSGFSLGYINEWTKGPKEATRLARKLEAIKSVLPEITNNPAEEMVLLPVGTSGDSLECYIGKKDGVPVGFAISTYSNKGFSGLIRIMIGFTADGKIFNTAVLEQKETPGLGTKMKDAKFKDQFPGKDPASFELKVKKDGGDVDAITGATISSRAFSGAAKMAVDALNQNKELLEK
ncbi:MAG: RnfABCDGE type electron transport complex subunit G [Saprospiraceae bacterium]|nr:RnfABCDGE type electron transport complex subunit G [Saprospiraceae bacterium]MCB9322359.1 RnfABCDGE type electron transport complex subunit G [Lewinellaceae bacterium]